MDQTSKEIEKVESTKDIYSDIYNAKVFYQLFKDKIRWCRDYGGWFIYNNKYWQHDNNDTIKRYAIKAHAHMCGDLEKIKDKKYFTHLKNSAADNKLNAMLSCSKAYLGSYIEEFDRNDYLFNCQNGVIDLKSGLLFPFAPEHLLTKYADVAYDREAQCPLWDKFLYNIFLGRQDIIDFMQMVIGYSLTASTQEQCLFIFHGRGRNGKSRFLEVLYHLMGTYTMNCPASTFIRKQQTQIPNDIARLKGSRSVTAVENNQNVSFDESIIKHLTGQDRITARYLGKEFFDYIPTFKIFFATNHKPNIRGTDDGIWRRVKLIPFDFQVTDEVDDKKLGEKLRAEMSGILNWAMAGCKKWLEHGLITPEVIKRATNSYKDEEDVIGQFIQDKCVLELNGILPVRDFSNRLIEHCGFKISQKQIGSYMEAHGYKDNDNRTTINGTTVRIYKGLRFTQALEKQQDMGWHE